MKGAFFISTLVAFSLCAGVSGQTVRINEFRIDQIGADVDEYFELKGPMGQSLDGMTYIVIGDSLAGGSGVIEAVVDLTGESIGASGLYLTVEDTFTLPGTPDLILPSATNGLNFENGDDVTHLLVVGFTGNDGDDLDTNDDGVLDIVPWSSILDCVALIGGTPNLTYCATEVGPEGQFLPGHVYRCEPDGEWRIGTFDPVGTDDTPSAENLVCTPLTCGDLGTGDCFEANGSPFCDDANCCNTVCSENLDCCLVEWTQDCVDLAEARCRFCGDAVTGCCFEVAPPGEESAYCDDALCCDAVCANLPGCCDVQGWTQACVDEAMVVCLSMEPAPDVIINEVRLDQPGTDMDEYFELTGAAGTSLNGATYLVLGDGVGGSGIVEAVVNLSGSSIGANGFFVAAEPGFTLGVANLLTNLNFENSDNVTHLVVYNFTGCLADDLDTDDDGVLDVTPWDSIVDCLALIETPGLGDQVYCATTVGPDGIFVPGQAYRCDPDGTWTVGEFDPMDLGETDTPNMTNVSCDFVPPCGSSNAGDCFMDTGTPNCDDVACCDAVCLTNPECCGDMGGVWDQVCADIAGDVCLACGSPEAGNCFEPNGSRFCSDMACCDLVCTPGQGFEFCCDSGWTQACADQALAICAAPDTPQQNDLVLGLSNASGLLTMELISGPVMPLGGMIQNDPWDEGFMQSMEFDNLGGIAHNPQGNLLGLNFGPGGGSGSIHSFATCIPVPTDQLIGDTSGVTISRLGGLSVSPCNTKIAVGGYDSQQVIVYDYTAGNCMGSGASLTNERETGTMPLCLEDTQGTTWLNDNTVLAFSSTGDIVAVNATTMAVTVLTTVDPAIGADPCGPGYTDLEYNPALSPFVYAAYSAFSGGTTNKLFVLDPDNSFNLLATIDYSLSMQTTREIAFDSLGNLFVSQFGAAVDYIPNANNLAMLADDNSVDWYISATGGSFPGQDVAAGTPIEGGCDCPSCPDFDGNNVVEAADLAQLLGAWGMPCTAPPPCCQDIDGDGDVDASDLAILLGAWGPCP